MDEGGLSLVATQISLMVNSWSQTFMRLPNALGVAEDPDTEGIQSIIEYVFQVVLVDSPVLPPHAFTQITPKLPIKFDAFIKSQVNRDSTVLRMPAHHYID